MVTSTDQRQTAPYAPLTNVLTVIRRYRERGLPDPVTLQELERIGVPSGNAPRTLAALRFLGLVTDEGRRTEAFNRLGRATSTEYPDVLAEIVQEAYRPVLTVVDPAEDSEIAVNDAFRHYQPQAQRDKMITLFMGLSREAGIVAGGPPERRSRRRSRAEPPQRTVRQTAEMPVESLQGVSSAIGEGPDFRLLSALMQQLPKSGKWSKERRDKWIQAMSAGVDLLVEIEEDKGTD